MALRQRNTKFEDAICTAIAVGDGAMTTAFPRRAVIQVPVIQSRRTDRIAIAQANDFVRGKASPSRGGAADAVPYCFDFLRARTIYVRGVNVRALQEAPFYYLYLRRNARSILSVPLEHGPLSGAAGGDPVFLFSPGRCGSTLLSRILFHAGIAAVSEPDFYTQMSTAFWSSRLNPLRAPFAGAMWAMTADLCAVLGASPVVKLRAESCRAPDLFLRDRHAHTLVMLRPFEDWARSTARVFVPGPGKAVRKYMRALCSFAYLRANSRCHMVRYEGLMSDPEAECAALGAFLGSPIAMDAVRRAMAADAQNDTPLEQRSLPGWEAKFDAAMRLWRSPRLVTARARLGLPD
jgi:hypothetical protein